MIREIFSRIHKKDDNNENFISPEEVKLIKILEKIEIDQWEFKGGSLNTLNYAQLRIEKDLFIIVTNHSIQIGKSKITNFSTFFEIYLKKYFEKLSSHYSNLIDSNKEKMLMDNLRLIEEKILNE